VEQKILEEAPLAANLGLESTVQTKMWVDVAALECLLATTNVGQTVQLALHLVGLPNVVLTVLNKQVMAKTSHLVQRKTADV